MAKMKWLTGKDILDRWSGQPFELLRAWKKRLKFYRRLDGAPQIRGKSCVECHFYDNDTEACMHKFSSCRHSDECGDGKNCGKKDKCPFCPEPYEDPVDDSILSERLMAAAFKLKDVEKFEERFLNSKETGETEIHPRRKKTYGIIIAALCEKFKIHLNSNDATSKIKSITDQFGENISDDTIRQIIKEIRDKIELEKRR